jgi:hypothetical protein
MGNQPNFLPLSASCVAPVQCLPRGCVSCAAPCRWLALPLRAALPRVESCLAGRALDSPRGCVSRTASGWWLTLQLRAALAVLCFADRALGWALVSNPSLKPDVRPARRLSS